MRKNALPAGQATHKGRAKEAKNETEKRRLQPDTEGEFEKTPIFGPPDAKIRKKDVPDTKKKAK